MNLKRIVAIELEGIDYKDYPDFVDAFILSAAYMETNGDLRDLTEEELDDLNENYREFIYDEVISRFF